MTLINSTVLMSGAQYFSNEQPINPYYNQESIDLEKAIQEHAQIKGMLERAGVVVTQVTPPSDSQDGVYTANWALVRGDTAILACLPNARKTEENYAEKVLQELGKTVIRVPEGLKFSGQGDALACGNYLFCGSGYRSDEAAQIFAAQQLGYERIQLQATPQLDKNNQPKINATSGWPDSFYYDIDLALSIIKGPTESEKGLVAYCPAAFTPESQAILEDFDGVDKIIVSERDAKEAFACNLVSTGETVIMSANAPELKSAFEAHGLTVVTPEITELAKGGGYIRCTTLTLA
ncbi:MAG: amidinotransferase [Candidatus Saccharibacteria bacterium]